MIITYTFIKEYKDCEFDMEYEFDPSNDMDECIEAYKETMDDEEKEEVKDWTEDDFNECGKELYEFAKEYFWEQARDEFEMDPDVDERAEDAYAYCSDPYSYNGVSRYDF